MADAGQAYAVKTGKEIETTGNGNILGLVQRFS